MRKALITILVLSLLGCEGTSMGPSKPGLGKGPGLGPPQDWVTGGGIIEASPGDTANFGFVAGEKRNELEFGHLTYIDSLAGIELHSLSIDSYTIIDAVTREFTGTATIDTLGTTATFTVTVADLGEPGRDDTFAITIVAADQRTYAASGTLIGGNIQLHERKLRIKPREPSEPDSIP
jgi:hypothetical protein